MAHTLTAETLRVAPASCGPAPRASCLAPLSTRIPCSRSRTHKPSSAHSSVCRPVCAVATPEGSAVGENPAWGDADYIALGVAQCYVKDEANKLQEIFVIEPIPAGALECMDNGGVTSYLHVTGITVGDALKEDLSSMPQEFRAARFCDEFAFRTLCASRTWKRQHPQEFLLKLVPVGAVRSDFNFSLEDKRVLNMESEVSDDDNIKQDISIDVYGRAKDDESPGADIEKLYNA